MVDLKKKKPLKPYNPNENAWWLNEEAFDPPRKRDILLEFPGIAWALMTGKNGRVNALRELAGMLLGLAAGFAIFWLLCAISEAMP